MEEIVRLFHKYGLFARMESATLVRVTDDPADNAGSAYWFNVDLSEIRDMRIGVVEMVSRFRHWVAAGKPCTGQEDWT